MRISLCLCVQLRVRRSFGIERAALIFDDFLFEKKKKMPNLEEANKLFLSQIIYQ